MRRLRWLIYPLAVLSLIVLPAVAWLLAELRSPYKGFDGQKYFTVQKGEHTAEILDRLYAERIIKRAFPSKIAYAFFLKRPKLKAGVYLFDKPMSPFEILRKLRRGEGILIKLTLREGLTMEQYSKELSAQLGSEENYLKAMKDPSLISGLDPKAPDLEGYLFPDTYLVAPFTSEKSVIKTIVDSFASWWGNNGRTNPGADLRETVILASIIEKETADLLEKPRMAGVFFNRLRIGMPLQSDPTVIYALERRGLYKGFLTKEDLQFADPFNTYVNQGLPPAPICSPGRESILAVLHPEKNGYLYFVSKGNGEHYFSPDLETHNRAVGLYLKNGKSR